ncbi:MAG: hypothetical protein JW764_00915 [Chlorobiaceae bacterium]|nr:hypothetical protein [Chlorobiaceae bacterium]
MLRAVILLTALVSLDAVTSNIEQYKLFRNAARHGATGEFAEAVREYRQLLDRYPAGILRCEASFNLAGAEYRLKHYRRAAELFATLPPGNAQLNALAEYNRGNALAMEGFRNGKNRPMLQQALASYRRALLTDPENNDARINYEIVSRALQHQQTTPPAPAPQSGSGAPERGGTGREIGDTMSRLILENARQEEARQMRRYFRPLQPRPSDSNQPDW